MNLLLEQYNKLNRFDLLTKLNVKNINDIPKIEKIVLNLGLKEASINKNKILPPFFAIQLITGQKPILTQAKKSIATFKLRKHSYTGLKVVLRNELMYDFLLRLNTIILPNEKEFQAFNNKNLDQNGNLNFGLKNIYTFPEIDKQFDNNKLSDSFGLNISIVTSCKDKNASKILLSSFGLPFLN